MPLWWIGVEALKPQGHFNLKEMTKFNGYRSWNEWNVSLWINNDYQLYAYCKDLIRHNTLSHATNIFLREWDSKTPDGAVYNKLCVYNTLKELKNG